MAGSFNGWSADAAPLAPEGDGYWSADVDGVAAGDQYRFTIVNGDLQLSCLDPYAVAVTSSIGNAIVYDRGFDWGDGGSSSPSWDELVIYELHVGTFDEQQGGAPGKFDRVAAKLPYLRDLGVNAIELMPVSEFGGYSSWGYNPAVPFAVEADYGGPDAFKRLLRAAHRHGIAVILDVVYNHFGWNDNSLWRFDGWSENNRGGIYFYNDWRHPTPWGDRPDYGRPEVRRYLRDNALQWLEEFRVDGLRWDMTAFIRNVDGRDGDPGRDLPDGWGLMRWVNDEIDCRQPWKLSIAEDMQGNDAVTRRTRDGGAGFDAQWDAAFVHDLRDVLAGPLDESRSMDAVRDTVQRQFSGRGLGRVIYTESHDESATGGRLPEVISPGDAGSWDAKKRSTLGAVLALTAPGIPMLFQGQEFLEDGRFQDRRPLDWSKAGRYRGILQLYTDLVRLRRDWWQTTRGLRGEGVQVHHLNDRDKVIAYHRWHEGGPRDSVVVVANLSTLGFERYALGFPRAGTWRVRCNTDWNGYDAGFGNFGSFDVVATAPGRDGLACSGEVGIGPYTAVILSQDG